MVSCRAVSGPYPPEWIAIVTYQPRFTRQPFSWRSTARIIGARRPSWATASVSSVEMTLRPRRFTHGSIRGIIQNEKPKSFHPPRGRSCVRELLARGEAARPPCRLRRRDRARRRRSDHRAGGADPHPLIGEAVPVRPVPDIVWDGCEDPALPPSAELRNCLSDNGAATFINADLCDETPEPSQDIGAVTCEHEPLPPQDP